MGEDKTARLVMACELRRVLLLFRRLSSNGIRKTRATVALTITKACAVPSMTFLSNQLCISEIFSRETPCKPNYTHSYLWLAGICRNFRASYTTLLCPSFWKTVTTLGCRTTREGLLFSRDRSADEKKNVHRRVCVQRGSDDSRK